jgi:hypothetical protein
MAGKGNGGNCDPGILPKYFKQFFNKPILKIPNFSVRELYSVICLSAVSFLVSPPIPCMRA